MLPGVEASHLLADPTACQRLQATAARVIGGLHQRTATPVVADEERLQRWIHDPIAVIRRLKRTNANSAGAEPALDRLAVELQSALAGRTLAVSWVHGDFAPGNILVTPDGATVTGIVDWELAAPDGLPQLDLVQLWLSTRMVVHQRELGDVVQELLDGADWLPHERALLEAAQSALPGEALRKRELVLLCWLRHITANLTKSTRYAGHWLWRSKNIEAVLRYL
jgi:aminoglycoside phosphotransferase (APT) family kinase protein